MTEAPIADPLDELNAPDLDPGKPTSDQIYRTLKSAILDTTLPPGCLVSETEVGIRFGASRTPVREAFANLRDDGLIVTRPSRGNFVSKLSEGAIRQAQFLREGLELATVTRLCDTGIPPGIQDGLKKSLRVQAEAVAANDNTRFQRQDDRFHTLLARATGFPRAEVLLLREKSALDRLRVLALSATTDKAQLLEEHRTILSAILAGDTAKSTEAMQAHLRSILDTLSVVRDANLDFFE